MMEHPWLTWLPGRLRKRIEARPALQGVIVNSGWLFAEKVLRMLLGMLVSVFVARYLGPERLGTLNYALAFVGIFGAATTLGLDNIVVRELVVHEEERDELLGTAFVLKLTGALLVLAVITVAVLAGGDDPHTGTVVLLVAAALLFQAFGVVDFYFQSRVLSKFVVKAQIAQLLFSSLFKGVLIVLGAPLLWFGLSVALDALVLACGFLVGYRGQRLSVFRWHFDAGIARRLLAASWPLLVSGIFISIHMRIDQIMLHKLASAQQVGVYSIAVKLTEMFYFVSAAVLTSLFPGMINLKKESEERYQLRLQQIYDLTAILAGSIALTVSLLSPLIIRVMYGEEFREAANVLAVYVWVMVIMTSSMVWGRWLLIENLQKYQMVIEFLVSVAVVTGNYLLITRYGAMGAAVSVLIGNFVVFVLLMLFFRELRQGSMKLVLSLLMPGFSSYVLYRRKQVN